MSRVIVMGGLLAMSVAVNGYLLATRDGSDSRLDSATAASSRPTTESASPATRPRSAPTPALDLNHRETMDGKTEFAKLDRDQLEQRLSNAEARLAKLLPIEDRFELVERSPENEARVKPFLDKVFNVESGKPAPYVVECHERICKLTVDEKIAGRDWMDPLQTDPAGQGMFAGMQFGRNGTFMQLEEPGRAAGQQAVVKLLMTLHDNKSIDECKKQNPTPGTATFAISIDPELHRFAIDVSGALAKQSLGVCVRRVVEDLIATVKLPPDASLGEDFPFTVRVP